MQSTDIWCEVSEIARTKIKEQYSRAKDKGNFGGYSILEEIFGKNNVCEKEILTWDDLCKAGLTHDASVSILHNDICNDGNPAESYYGLYSRKAIATLKIAQLVESAYGGFPTDKDIEDNSKELFHISLAIDGSIHVKPWNGNNIRAFMPLVFKTEELATKFLKNNRDLVSDFYMIPVTIIFDESDRM